MLPFSVKLPPSWEGTQCPQLRIRNMLLRFLWLIAFAFGVCACSEPSADCVSSNPASCGAINAQSNAISATTEPKAPPFDLSNDKFSLAPLNQNARVENVTIRHVLLKPVGQSPCLPDVIKTGFPLCGAKETTRLGRLATEDDKGLEGAEVRITHNFPCNIFCAEKTLTSVQNGSYGTCNLCTSCINMVFTPYKNDDPLNGVSTFDLVLINRHILGLQPLGSPYKMIAADANASRSITTFDIVEFRKLILGIYTALPNNTSWRFVDKDFQFPDPSNPFKTPFPESITVTSPPVGPNIDRFCGH